MAKSYIQVPPQSTGKKVVTEFRKELYFDNLTGSFEAGDTIAGATSGATGTVTAVVREGFTTTSGQLFLTDFDGTWVNNEEIQIGGVTQALVELSTGQTEYDIQKFIITDPNNLENNQRIDRFGATLNTFTDGAPIFGPFGTLWGYYDDNNGFFWELNGTTLYIVLRSNSTGSVVDTKVAQEDFSFDKLDGTGSIGFNLDITKGNIYFIDFQWLGAGRVKFGVVESQGSRLNAHIIENANINPVYPYTRTASLPLRVEQFNTGAAASTSEMRWACSVVKHTSSIVPSGVQHSYDGPVRSITPADGEVPIIAIRPAQYINGIDNHSIIKGISTIVANTSQGFTKFKYYVGVNQALTGATWGPCSSPGAAEIDSSDSSTFISAFTQHKLTTILAPNKTEMIRDLSPRETRTFELYNKADLTQQLFVVTAQAMTDSADVFAAINWEEYMK